MKTVELHFFPIIGLKQIKITLFKHEPGQGSLLDSGNNQTDTSSINVGQKEQME